MPSPAAERGSATVTLAAVAALLLLIVAVIAGAAGGITGQEAAACTAQPAASSAAAAIPANYLADFKSSGNRGTASRGPSWPPSAKSKAASAPTTGRPAPERSAPCSSSRRPGRCTATAGTS